MHHLGIFQKSWKMSAEKNINEKDKNKGRSQIKQQRPHCISKEYYGGASLPPFLPLQKPSRNLLIAVLSKFTTPPSALPRSETTAARPRIKRIEQRKKIRIRRGVCRRHSRRDSSGHSNSPSHNHFLWAKGSERHLYCRRFAVGCTANDDNIREEKQGNKNRKKVTNAGTC